MGHEIELTLSCFCEGVSPPLGPLLKINSGFITPPIATRIPFGETGTQTSSAFALPMIDSGRVEFVKLKPPICVMSTVIILVAVVFAVPFCQTGPPSGACIPLK